MIFQYNPRIVIPHEGINIVVWRIEVVVMFINSTRVFLFYAKDE